NGINFSRAWVLNNLNTFPNVYLDKGEDFSQAWSNNGEIGSFPAFGFPSMSNGSNMIGRIDGRLTTADYSNLLIAIEANNTNTNVVFGAGLSKYNSSAVAARNALLARGWIITDAGLE